jgi:chromate transporter
MRDDNIILALIVLFAPLSLLAIGGWASVLAPMHHQVVEVNAWMTQREFIDIFAITRAAPGPGAMIVTLIGWKMAGWWGAIVASLAIFIPSSALSYSVGRSRSCGRRPPATSRSGSSPPSPPSSWSGARRSIR